MTGLKNIVKEDWYVSNMSPITQYTYAISLLNYKLSEKKYIHKNNKGLTEIEKTPRVINYLKIWNNQSVDSELKKHLLNFLKKCLTISTIA